MGLGTKECRQLNFSTPLEQEQTDRVQTFEASLPEVKELERLSTVSHQPLLGRLLMPGTSPFEDIRMPALGLSSMSMVRSVTSKRLPHTSPLTQLRVIQSTTPQDLTKCKPSRRCIEMNLKKTKLFGTPVGGLHMSSSGILLSREQRQTHFFSFPSPDGCQPYQVCVSWPLLLWPLMCPFLHRCAWQILEKT